MLIGVDMYTTAFYFFKKSIKVQTLLKKGLTLPNSAFKENVGVGYSLFSLSVYILNNLSLFNIVLGITRLRKLAKKRLPEFQILLMKKRRQQSVRRYR